jgi:glycosyltransferase involved in cell wall biosynthesis
MSGVEFLKKCAPHATVTELYQTVSEHLHNQEEKEQRPFLSVITRTIANRMDCLREVFLCLAGQECMDFEVLVMGHNLAGEKKECVMREIENAPSMLAGKIYYHDVTGGTRTTPLNMGFQRAKGSYIAILDDDDLPLANWVSAFYSLYGAHNGKIFHTKILKQVYDRVCSASGEGASFAVSMYYKDYMDDFDYANMPRLNKCPPISIAFPRWIYHNYGLYFDESLTTTEDWDFIMRAAFLCGVSETGAVSGIYRWWREGESSRTVHQQTEWDLNQIKIEKKFTSGYYLLPPQGVADVIELNKKLEGKQHECNVLKNLYDERIFCRNELAEIRKMMDSFSWKITAPLRIKGYMTGIWKPLKRLEQMDYHQACRMHDKMLKSKSTQFANRMRKRLKPTE